jgi:hypothetical protein
MMKTLIAAFALAAITVTLAIATEDVESVSIKKPFGQHGDKASSNTATQITWQGGPVLLGQVPIYVIYYGVGFPSTTQDIVNKFLAGLSTTPQFDVNTTYCEDQTTTCGPKLSPVSGVLSFPIKPRPANVFTDSGSQGAQLGTKDIGKVLQHAFQSGLTLDDGAIYVLITSPPVKVSGFCGSFCAYHTHSTTIVSGHNIHYAVVPEPGSSCTVCDGNFAVYKESVTPTGDAGADEMIDSIMHELSETVTDPDLNAWFTSKGEENGDLCNYTYGSATFQAPNGATANASWNGYNYLIQQIWENRPLPQGCASKP